MSVMCLWPMLVVSLVLVGVPCESFSQELNVDFYGQQVRLEYDADILLEKRLKANEADLQDFYKRLLTLGYKPLVESLQNYKRQFQLNDWLYYSLVDTVSALLDSREVNSSCFRWFLLGESGYKVQASFSGKHALIWVESDETVSRIPKDGKRYCLNYKGLSLLKHQFSRFNPYRNNKSRYSFFFSPLPVFPEKKTIRKTFRLMSFKTSKEELFNVDFDSAVIHCMGDMQDLNLVQTFSVPLTANAEKLVTQMAEVTLRYNDSIRVSYVMDFVVRNARYASDTKTFGVNEKWATPEQFLFNGRGDCEDRSAFLYYALKKIVRRPVIIIDFPYGSHLNVAINLELKRKPDLMYKGKPYYICETSSVGSFMPVGSGYSLNGAKYKVYSDF